MYVTVIVHNDLEFDIHRTIPTGYIPEEWSDTPLEAHPPEIRSRYYQGLTQYLLDQQHHDLEVCRFIKHLLAHLYPLGYTEQDILYFATSGDNIHILIEV